MQSLLLLLKHIDPTEINDNDFKDEKVCHEGGQDSCCQCDQQVIRLSCSDRS